MYPSAVESPAKMRSAVPSFDTALLVVSECLTEATSCEERGADSQARRLFALAEKYAVSVGYLELIRLVWTYQSEMPFLGH
jgi:hypothetical protein